MFHSQQVDEVFLSTGDAAVSRNDLHGRPKFNPEITRVLTRTYARSAQEVPLVLQEFPDSLVKKAQATKAGQQNAKCKEMI
jgi:hypothetical protein